MFKSEKSSKALRLELQTLSANLLSCQSLADSLYVNAQPPNRDNLSVVADLLDCANRIMEIHILKHL